LIPADGSYESQRSGKMAQPYFFQFAPGESSKTISIAISDFGGARGSWSLKIALSDNEGNATFIGGNREATVMILGRDAVLRTKNPN